MLVWKQWSKVRNDFGKTKIVKVYRILFLFGIIPIFIFIDG